MAAKMRTVSSETASLRSRVWQMVVVIVGVSSVAILAPGLQGVGHEGIVSDVANGNNSNLSFGPGSV
jgi:hypothetical protein